MFLDTVGILVLVGFEEVIRKEKIAIESSCDSECHEYSFMVFGMKDFP